MGPDYYYASVEIDESAGTDESYSVHVPRDGEWELVRAVFCVDTTTAADATNYSDLSIECDGTEVASRTTASSALTAQTAYDLSLSSAAANLLTGATDLVEVKKTDSGTGAALAGRLLLSFVQRNDG